MLKMNTKTTCYQKTGSDCPQTLLRRTLPLSMLALSAVLLTGCQVLTYSGPNGERFTRSSLGSATSISSLVVETGTNGIRRVELQGYQNDSTQALGVVTEAAVRAAVGK